MSTLSNAYERAEAQLNTAASGKPPTEEQRDSLLAVRNHAVGFLAAIFENVPDNRDRSLAITAVEDALMRANRGVFTGEQPRGR